MDIQQLGARYLNSAAYTGAALGLSGALQGADGNSFSTGTFEDMLTKAKTDEILNTLSRLQKQEKAAEGEFPLSGNRDAVAALPSSSKVQIDKDDKLYEQCEALETFMIKTLISSMRNTVQKTGLLDEGFAGKMYEDMLYDEYAKTFTKNAGFGMAELAYLELTGQRGARITR
jgi:flagellar protein FlgJ